MVGFAVDASVDASDFFPALVSVVYDTAERIGAVMEIEFGDIDREGWLTVRGEFRKGKTRDKRFRLRSITLQRIDKIRRSSTTKRIFDWPQNYNHLFYRFGKILEAAGLPNNRRSKWHKVRRTTASYFEAAGGNATQLLDHTDRRTTERYLDPRVIKQVQPCDIVAGIGETSPPNAKPDGDSEFIDELKKLMDSRKT